MNFSLDEIQSAQTLDYKQFVLAKQIPTRESLKVRDLLDFLLVTNLDRTNTSVAMSG